MYAINYKETTKIKWMKNYSFLAKNWDKMKTYIINSKERVRIEKGNKKYGK